MQTNTSLGSRLLNDFIFKPLKTIFIRSSKEEGSRDTQRRALWEKGLNRHHYYLESSFIIFCVFKLITLKFMLSYALLVANGESGEAKTFHIK